MALKVAAGTHGSLAWHLESLYFLFFKGSQTLYLASGTEESLLVPLT